MLDYNFFIWSAHEAKNILLAAGLMTLLVIALRIIKTVWYKMLGVDSGSRKVMATGLVGLVNLHVSKSIICPIFGHKIDRFSLFQKTEDGEVGEVQHSYVLYTYSFLSVIGKLPIGLASLFGGISVVAIATHFILPQEYILNALYKQPINIDFNLNNIYHSFVFMLSTLYYSIEVYPVNFSVWFFILASISMHIAPSKGDLRMALNGFLFLLIASLAVVILCGYFQFDGLNRFFQDAGGMANIVLMQLALFLLAGIIMLIAGSVLVAILGLLAKKSKPKIAL